MNRNVFSLSAFYHKTLIFVENFVLKQNQFLLLLILLNK